MNYTEAGAEIWLDTFYNFFFPLNTHSFHLINFIKLMQCTETYKPNQSYCVQAAAHTGM